MKVKETLRLIFLPREKELRTVWKIEREERKGYLVGTAHFFPFRFRKSLERLIGRADICLFEGPLDEKSQSRVVELGSQGEGSLRLYEALGAQNIRHIEKCTGQAMPESRPFSLLPSLGPKNQGPLYLHFQKYRPWLAFFNLWSQYLKGKGWKYSVDLEALEVATRMGKEIHFLETIDEQVAALEGIPMERMVNFLIRVHLWDHYTRAYVQTYLQGDLEKMMSGMGEFPSRCSSIIENRDPIMYARMMAFLQRGQTITFVGTPHIPGLKNRLEADGYRVEPIRELEN